MSFSVAEWERGFSAKALAEIAALWNQNAGDRHAFFPWTGELLAAQLTSGRGVGQIFTARTETGELAGAAHATFMFEDGYPPAGAVEMLLVDKRFRGRGIGAALLRKCVVSLEEITPRLDLIDALGAWPFGHVYTALADGSERSGVFIREECLHRLFRQAGFQPVRKSLVMRADLTRAFPRPLPPGSGFHIGVRRENTWLDRVFRNRELWDHNLLSGGHLLSRAIFGLMEDESRRAGQVIFSLFGVNTPHDQQRRGYAGANLAHLMVHLAKLGARILELHVYADNLPALALYRRLGFVEVAETVMLHKSLKNK